MGAIKGRGVTLTAPPIIMASFETALIHYRIKYYTLAALGAGDPPERWAAEYEEVAGMAFSPTILTGNSEDGRSAEGERNFSMTEKLRALIARRAELDPVFASAINAPAPLIQFQPMGSVVRFGY